MLCNLRNARGVTLTEMLTVTACVMLVLVFGLDALKKARSTGLLTLCASQLSHTGKLFNQYRDDYHFYPEFAPPTGLGDRSNWYDLYGFSDPGFYYFSPTLVPGGICLGDRTADPRVPRLLVHYTDNQSVEEICCPSQGDNVYWKNIGPYYYNTNNPFNTFPVSARKWVARCRKDPAQPLAACQNPDELFSGSGERTWRHGARTVTDGINNHLFRDGSVQPYEIPLNWSGR